MKKLLLILSVCLLSVHISGQADDASKKAMKDYVLSKMTIDYTNLDPAVLGKIFTGSIYEVNLGFTSIDGSVLSGSDYHLIITDGKVTELPPPSTDMELNLLHSLVRKDFLLKDEAAATLFQNALDIIYPEDTFGKPNPEVKHMKKGNQWIFIRDKFFDDYEAIIVTTNTNGSISKIEVKLGYSES